MCKPANGSGREKGKEEDDRQSERGGGGGEVERMGEFCKLRSRREDEREWRIIERARAWAAETSTLFGVI